MEGTIIYNDDGDWIGLGLGDSSEEIHKLKEYMRGKFRSYAGHLADTPLFDVEMQAVVAEMQDRYVAAGKLRIGTFPRGVINLKTKQVMGYLDRPPAPPEYVGYAVPGTWGVWNIGPHCMAINRNPAKVYVQGIGTNTGAFLTPDPRHSYIDARDEQVAELLRWALPEPRKKIVSGYSLGADSVVRFLDRWPADRRDEIAAVFTFGSPGRPPGRTKLGNDPGGAGISGFYTPEWARDREWSYAIDGDMYADANSPLMNALYDILTRMEASVEFMKYLFGILTSSIGPALLGVAGAFIPGFGALKGLLGLITAGSSADTDGPPNLFAMLTNMAVIIPALVGALKFVFTGAHGKYWINREFEGMTAEDHAASVVARLVA